MYQNNIANLNDLVAISRQIGNDLDLVQGAGGNTSFKDNEVLWVKASGCRLKDAGRRNIFVPVDFSAIIRDLENGENSSFEPEVLPIVEDSTLRPSIETSLHALMPHQYVVHVHSVNVIGNAVLHDGENKVTQLLEGINWSWVPYARPGIPLARAVQRVMRPGLKVLVLANHGLVLGAETKDDVLKLLNEVESRLYRQRRQAEMVDDNKIKSLVKNTEYRHSNHALVHSLAFDPVALSIVVKDPLYPDHIVFLGREPFPIMTRDEACCFLQEEKPRGNHKVIIVKDVGVIRHKSLSESAEEMLHCLANVALRIHPEDKLRCLTEREGAEIAGWDAEKFRQETQS